MIDAYAAGLIDGEGSIQLDKGSRFRYPVVSMASTTYELLSFMKENYGGSISSKKLYKENHKESWSWCVTHDRAIDTLARVVVYLREPTKKRKAELILAEYKLLTPRNGKYTEEAARLKLDFENRFRGIKAFDGS